MWRLSLIVGWRCEAAVKSIDLPGGIGWVREDSDPPVQTPAVVIDEDRARMLAAAAVVEQINAAAFASELAEVRAGSAAPDVVAKPKVTVVKG